jgi:hypothetical protein
MKTLNLPGWILTIPLICGILAGCGRSQPDAAAPAAAQKEQHHPPHGGTLVKLGDEFYYVELVLDAPAEKMQAYIFDGELENYVRLTMESFEVTAKLSGREEDLVFKAVATNATGEKVGDTALFDARADWLKTETHFQAVLKQITVKGQTFQNVAFNFP